jgi:hypothetical protein
MAGRVAIAAGALVGCLVGSRVGPRVGLYSNCNITGSIYCDYYDKAKAPMRLTMGVLDANGRKLTLKAPAWGCINQPTQLQPTHCRIPVAGAEHWFNTSAQRALPGFVGKLPMQSESLEHWSPKHMAWFTHPTVPETPTAHRSHRCPVVHPPLPVDTVRLRRWEWMWVE